MTEEKKGLKKTDVGLIPEDWEVYELGDLGSFKNGINKGKDSFGHGSPFVNLMDVFGIRSISGTKKLKLVDTNPSEKSNYSLQKGDVLFVRSSVKPSGVGLTTLIDDDLEEAVYSGFLIRFRENGNIYHDYKAYCFHEPGFRDRLIAKSSVSANTNINQDSLKVLKIPLPPTLEEQQAIASALSDVDELINSLNGLIQKKQAIKKGTMQQLLTGKKRLPGFDGKWREKELIDIADKNSSYSFTGGPFGSDLKKSHYTDKGVRVIQLQNIGDGNFINESKVYTTEEKADELESANIYPGEIILSKMGDPVGRACIIPDNHKRYLMCSDGIRLKIDQDKYDSNFIFYTINFKRFRTKVVNASSGSTRKRIGLTDLKKIPLLVPEFKEQKAIGCILSDMDRELYTLRQKRDKYVQIKQGMMQELLTGKTRLVKPKSEPIQTAQPKRQRSWAFEEAVIISTLIDRFYKETFFLSRFRYVKYSYLLKRYNEMDVANYMKKAAGPYNPQTRYGGPERIAKDKNYIVPATSGKFKGFKPGDNIDEAIGYFRDWFGTEILDWLEQFRFTKNDELELITTVDLAMRDLNESGTQVSLMTVKRLISDHEEWRPKLKRKVFSDERIEYAMDKVNELFD